MASQIRQQMSPTWEGKTTFSSEYKEYVQLKHGYRIKIRIMNRFSIFLSCESNFIVNWNTW